MSTANKEDLDGNKLLSFCRASLEKHFGIKNHDLTSWMDETMKKNYGVFVSLYNQGDLRGCIGHLETSEPLIEEIPYLSIAAATQDNRFHSVTADELNQITIELSLLTIPEKVEGRTAQEKVDQIVPHVHGVILGQGFRKATFLPQVWDSLSVKEDFFRHLSMKAGLSANAWQENETEYSVYQVQAFKE
jgi:AmmeMemoRadiSam system protein A